MRDTAIIIVNYRTPGLVLDCLHSLQSEIRDHVNGRVIVVDNASNDGSVEHLRTSIKAANWKWVELLPLERNGGFAFGNNAAIRMLLQSSQPPDYFHLLNPDTYIRPGAVKELVDFLEIHPAVGIAGSRLENPDGSSQCSAFRFHGVWSELERGLRFGAISKILQRWMVAPPTRDIPHRADWVNGASMMVRRAVFETIGLMDDDFFLYYEETDFCRRARLAGWPCWFVPASRVVHLEGQSTGATGAGRGVNARRCTGSIHVGAIFASTTARVMNFWPISPISAAMLPGAAQMAAIQRGSGSTALPRRFCQEHDARPVKANDVRRSSTIQPLRGIAAIANINPKRQRGQAPKR